MECPSIRDAGYNLDIMRRRGFLKTVAAAAGGVPQLAAQANHAGYPRTFTGRQLAMIAFPLGGVAAGCVSLGGRGQLRDWEIFNRADKRNSLQYTFAGIWAQSGKSKPVAHVLESRLLPPYEGADGLSPDKVSGLTRLENATFTGEYPLAKIDFHDRQMPVAVSLEAFTPVIPLDAEESGLPAIVLRYRVRNTSKETARVSIVYSIENPVGIDTRTSANRGAPGRECEHRTSGALDGLFLTNPAAPASAPTAGSLALAVTDAGAGKVTWLRGWPKAKWWASPLLFWDDFSSDGELGPEAAERNTISSLCLQREIPPGGSADYTFILAWHFPNRTPAWCGWAAPKDEQNAIIGNHYCRRFQNAWAAADYLASNLVGLETRMRQFLTAMRETTMPAAVKDAALANLSTLATPTCFRTADGRFRGFEGINDQRGCCHGTCTHVWNYETTTQSLFPTLSRSMREAAFDLSDRLDGVLPMRLDLPEGRQAGGTTAADGTMGQIIKTYLDWQLSGNAAWLAAIWPKVKRALEFCWVEGGWDSDRDGVMEGVQHNTYDVEFYGPNPMCGVYYLGALRAAEEMARASGDAGFAGTCRKLFEGGSKWIDANLFNGEYYIQKIRGVATTGIAKPLRSTGGAEDPEHPDFQLGEGCLADQLIGQYLADVAGLGPLLDPAKIRKTMESIYRYNHRSQLTAHDSVQRIYALNDEAAVLICDYGKVTRPRIPFPYNQEAWTGIEYLVGTQFIEAGLLREGIGCFEEVRRRFDGERRNPWDEPECGHHYARAMSAWSGILALSGFRYLGSEGSLSIHPKAKLPVFTSFWSTGTGWGTFTRTPAGLSLSILAGTLPCRSVVLTGAHSATASAKLGQRAVEHQLKSTGGKVRFEFNQSLELRTGDKLVLTV